MNSYETFHQLHHQPASFILPNTWNAKSAQLLEAAGFSAIATSSGAIADSLGYPDGEQIPFAELLYMIKRIKAVTTLPLSVDMERGYTDDPAQLRNHIQQLIDAGVAGINIEDAQGTDSYLHKLTIIKEHLTQTGQQLFINARTDVFLQKLDAPLPTTIERARLYQEAGADGLFVTAVQDPAIIRDICAVTTLPVNVVGNAALPASVLQACGVKRISMAVLLYKATYRHMERTASAIQAQQSFEVLF